LSNSKLIDRYSRNLNYLRISITDRCNLRCMYCVPREHIPRLAHAAILRYEEILRLVKIGVHLGISKVRITGGEPLIRKGVYDFLKKLTQIKGLVDVSLTTNGVFLKDNIIKIKAAGIKRINISLDTLNRQKYKKITGQDTFYQVWAGIKLAQEIGFAPIKLNMVALKGVNEDELIDFARLSLSNPFHVRFIEHMPIGTTKAESGKSLLATEIKARIQFLGDLEPIGKEINDGPAERFKFKGAKGEVGFIRPISRHFCDTCNRLRLTANGQLRSCLLSDRQEDLKMPLRSGCSDSELSEIFLRAVNHKPSEHHLTCKEQEKVEGQMSAIGG
jgi:cyclic pyranopterin phosphate synthase